MERFSLCVLVLFWCTFCKYIVYFIYSLIINLTPNASIVSQTTGNLLRTEVSTKDVLVVLNETATVDLKIK